MNENTHPHPRDETIVPQPRRDGIEVSALHDELILYDTVEQRAHALNRTVAAVWQACDGVLSVPELRLRVEQRLGVSLGEEVIWLALRQLEQAKLVTGLEGRGPRLTRQQVIKAGVLGGAVLLPAITSLRPQVARAAVSPLSPPSPPPPPPPPADTSTATATNTPVPPTATSTATNTPVPPTATSTVTNTPVPPTATSTATNTPIPHTATSTATNTPTSGGGGGGGGCFTGHTPVVMADRTIRALAEIAVGDRVLAYDEVARELRACAVIQTFAHEPEPYLHIWLADGSRIEVTANHPLSRDLQWVSADRVRAGDRLDALATGLDGIVQLAVERVEPSGRVAPVFNLEVDGAHTYFANGVLAHNKSVF